MKPYMREQIVEQLRLIEKEEQVRIIYACESGSRAWGFPSKDSDYDVRFLYITPSGLVSVYLRQERCHRTADQRHAGY